MLDKNMSLTAKIIVYILLLFFGFILFAPFLYVISISLASPYTNTTETFTLFPHDFYLGNFKQLFSSVFTGDNPIGIWMINSLIFVGFAIIGQIFSSTLVAYGFAKLRYKHKNIFFLVLLATMMLPAQVTMIPVFLIFKNLGMYNTLLPLILPQFFASAYNVFFTRQFMTGIPSSLYEAAEMDGLGPLRIYWQIYMPLLKPAIVAIAIFTFNFAWGDFMGPLIYTSDINKATMALGAQLLSASSNPTGSVNMSVVMCMSFILTIPQILIYFFGQKDLFQINISAGNSGVK